MKQYLDYKTKTPSRWQHVTVSGQSVSESFNQPIRSKRWFIHEPLGYIWDIESLNQENPF